MEELKGVTECVFVCCECYKTATKTISIGLETKHTCDNCYERVYKKPRTFNRKGRRLHEKYIRSKQYQIDQLNYYKEMLKRLADEQVLPVSE